MHNYYNQVGYVIQKKDAIGLPKKVVEKNMYIDQPDFR